MRPIVLMAISDYEIINLAAFRLTFAHYKANYFFRMDTLCLVKTAAKAQKAGVIYFAFRLK